MDLMGLSLQLNPYFQLPQLDQKVRMILEAH